MPAFVPPYATVPVLDGRLALGTWQSICLVDLNVDNDERTVRFASWPADGGDVIRAYRPDDEAAVRTVVDRGVRRRGPRPSPPSSTRCASATHAPSSSRRRTARWSGTCC